MSRGSWAGWGAVLSTSIGLLGCADAPPDRSGFVETGEAESGMTICPAGDTVPGLDVSYYQADIDWTKVAAAGYGFAITRISHSTSFMDPKFEANWAGIKANGMIRGAYQYFEPGDNVEAQAQVVIDAVGMLGPGDLPVTIDVESADFIAQAPYRTAIRTWLDLVEAGTGKKPIIYTGKYYWQDHVASNEFNEYPLWHAAYPNACQPPNAPPPECTSCPNLADQFDDWQFWQYTSSGSVPGISGNVDLNIFNGSLDDLKSLANSGGYGAEVVEVVAPSTVLTSESFVARVTLKNTGTLPWDASTKLGTSEPRDRESPFASPAWPAANRPGVVSGAVAVGESFTFEIALTAPAEVGSYTEHFGVVQESVAWFSDQEGPADTAIALSFQVIDGVESSGASGGAGSGGSGGSGGEDGAGGDDDGDGCSTSGRPSSSSFTVIVALALALGRRRSKRSPRVVRDV